MNTGKKKTKPYADATGTTQHLAADPQKQITAAHAGFAARTAARTQRFSDKAGPPYASEDEKRRLLRLHADDRAATEKKVADARAKQARMDAEMLNANRLANTPPPVKGKRR